MHCFLFCQYTSTPSSNKRFSKGFHVALKSGNLHIPKCSTPDFRIWTHLNLSNVTKPKIQNLRKLVSAPSIPIDQLRAQISNFRHISSDTDQPWIYYVGGGSGSGLVLLFVICCLLYWCCKRSLPVLLMLIQRTQTQCTPEWVP